MFTGLVEEVGRVRSLRTAEDAGDAHLGLSAEVVLGGTRAGDSILVNGACLTVDEVHDGGLVFYTMPETLRRTALGDLSEGSPVNLERAVRVSDRLGGHVVQGHVDGTGEVLSVTPDEHWTVVRTSLPGGLGRYVVEKGSITVDGVSLTVSAIGDDWFEVSLIPTTLARTTLGRKGPGDPVNLEVDVIAKHVEKLLQAGVVPGRTGGAR